MKNSCCCFGHREVYKNTSDVLPSVIESLMKENITTFMTGGIGEFDSEFACAVRGLKGKYPNIKLLLVKPYFSNELNTHREYYEMMYDEVIIPAAIEEVHYKSAITKRNRWMVENSNVIVSYVCRDFGGAYDAIKYACKLNKRVINICYQIKT